MNNPLSIEQCKAIAQAQAAGNDFCVFGGKVWSESWEDLHHAFLEFAEEKGFDKNDARVLEFIEETSTELDYDDSYNADYVVLTDSEADEKSEEYIKEALWAFNSSFLSSVTGFDESIFEAIQANDKCEGNNNAILQLVGDNLDDLISQAISSDGRGHFLNTYDGNEEEFNCKDYTGENEYLFIYRMN
jgi:hypothetical protein